MKVLVYTISKSNPKITSNSKYFLLLSKYGNKIIKLINIYIVENQLGFVKE